MLTHNSLPEAAVLLVSHVLQDGDQGFNQNSLYLRVLITS